MYVGCIMDEQMTDDSIRECWNGDWDLVGKWEIRRMEIGIINRRIYPITAQRRYQTCLPYDRSNR